MLKLAALGHVALRVADVERSKKFYGEVLGFEVIEEDPSMAASSWRSRAQPYHRSLPGARRTAPAATPARWAYGTSRSWWRARRLQGGLVHAAEHGVPIDRAMDHVSQKSIYFHDPDGTVLEIYYELPDARELFRQGRGDRDTPLVFPP
jgi:catechol-2,3-dioxygenase